MPPDRSTLWHTPSLHQSFHDLRTIEVQNTFMLSSSSVLHSLCGDRGRRCGGDAGATPRWCVRCRHHKAAAGVMTHNIMATRLVSYSHAAHHAAIRFICKDVYGGTDYLPDHILRYSQDDQKVVRVLEKAESREVLGIGEWATRTRHS